MKKLALGLGLAVIAGSAFAANTGFYAGVNAGYNQFSNLAKGRSGASISKKSGVAYGIDGGYNFDQYFGLRSDITKYNDLKIKGEPKLKYYSIDLLAMGFYPLNSQYSLLGGAGVAYLNESAKGDSIHFYRPEVKVGGAYQINKQLSAELTYSQIFGKGSLTKYSESGNAKDFAPATNTVMLGVNYSF